jgi:uncharacterized membrane protein YesL
MRDVSFPRWLHTISALVVLNLCWLVASLPLVTGAAATVALQATLHRWLEHDEASLVVAFVREFRLRIRQLLLPGIAVLAMAAAWWFGLTFWLAANPFVGVPMIAALMVIGAFGLASLLVFVEIASVHPCSGRHDYVVATGRWFALAPWRFAASLFMVLGWVPILVLVPTLLPAIGASIPAYLLHRIHHGANAHIGFAVTTPAR